MTIKKHNASSSALRPISTILLIFLALPIAKAQAYPPSISDQIIPIFTLVDKDRQEVSDLVDKAIVEERDNLHDRIQDEVDDNFNWVIGFLTALIAIVGMVPVFAGVFAFLLHKGVIHDLASRVKETLEATIDKLEKEFDQDSEELIQKQKLIFEQELERIRRNSEEICEIKSGISTEANEIHKLKSQLTQEMSEKMPPSLQDSISHEARQELKSLTARISFLEALFPSIKSTANEYVIQGNALFFEGKYDQAIEKYDAALALEPTNYEILYRKGGVLISKRQFADALLAYEQALKLKPENNEIWRSWGEAVRQLGRQEEVIRHQTSVIQENPSSENWYKLGNLLFSLGDYNSALDKYSKALELDPDNMDILHSRGNILADLERFEDAIRDYDKVLTINPRSTWALNSRGYALVTLGHYEEALKDYQTALSITPNDGWILERCGYALLYRDRDEEALDHFDKSIQAGWDIPSVYIHRGHALSKLNRLEEADKSYAKALERCDMVLEERPDSYGGWYDKAVCYALQGKASLAIECLDHAIQLCPLCRLKARTRKDFDLIRQEAGFQQLLEKSSIPSTATCFR